MLLLRDLALEIGDRGERLLVFGTHLLQLELRDDPALVAQIEEPHALASGIRGAAGDLQPLVEVAQRHVFVRHGRDQREQRRAPPVLGGEEVRPRRFGLALQLAEEVDLPRSREQRLVAVEGAPHVILQRRRTAEAAHLLAGEIGARAHLRKEPGAGRAEHASGFLHARGGDANVLVLRERRGDELVQHRVVELLPPCGVHEVGGIAHFITKRSRRVDLGAHVVRSHLTTSERDECRDRDRGPQHAGSLLAAPRRARLDQTEKQHEAESQGGLALPSIVDILMQ